MDENSLYKLALVTSLTGLLILFTISESIEIKQYKISEINKKLLNKQIQVQGTITRITETPGLFIFDMKDKSGTITAILFKEENINITSNQKIQAEGKVIQYKNKLELEISKIII
ncbi:MAG: OB-fold nucleic acid binding domain-containing protein [Nanoarchaeota archaeon]